MCEWGAGGAQRLQTTRCCPSRSPRLLHTHTYTPHARNRETHTGTTRAHSRTPYNRRALLNAYDTVIDEDVPDLMAVNELEDRVAWGPPGSGATPFLANPLKVGGRAAGRLGGRAAGRQGGCAAGRQGDWGKGQKYRARLLLYACREQQRGEGVRWCALGPQPGCLRATRAAGRPPGCISLAALLCRFCVETLKGIILPTGCAIRWPIGVSEETLPTTRVPACVVAQPGLQGAYEMPEWLAWECGVPVTLDFQLMGHIWADAAAYVRHIQLRVTHTANGLGWQGRRAVVFVFGYAG